MSKKGCEIGEPKANKAITSAKNTGLIVSFLTFLTEADRDELDEAEVLLRHFVKENDPEYKVISLTAHRALRNCLRQAAKY